MHARPKHLGMSGCLVSNQASGWTLVELTVTLSIVAILLAVALPQFQQWMDRQTVIRQVSALASTLRLGRSYAIMRGRPVALCRQAAVGANGLTGDQPAHASGLTCEAQSITQASVTQKGWANGWLLFEDANNNAALDEQETIYVVQEAFALSGGIAPNRSIRTVRFMPTGLVQTNSGANAMASFVIRSRNQNPKDGRRIILGWAGRTRCETGENEANSSGGRC